jgi:hypothetical protein
MEGPTTTSVGVVVLIDVRIVVRSGKWASPSSIGVYYTTRKHVPFKIIGGGGTLMCCGNGI